VRRIGALLSLLALASCFGPKANPHYQLGSPYQTGGTWFYPTENYALDETGLAAVYGSGHPSLTSDGEAFDQSVVMAGHPTIQLPAIARLTNLENGRSILVRINDRGTGNPGRLIDVTRRTATLLGMAPDVATRVRLKLLPEESHAAIDGLPGRPRLAMAAVPRDAVVATDLAPPPGIAATTHTVGANAVSSPPPDATPTIARLPETVTQGVANPGRLWVRLDAFAEYPYAIAQQKRMSGWGATIDRIFNGRERLFRVQVGPFDSVQQADRVLRDALARGIPDAHIVVD
jgi:rare lipoprotein A